MTDHATPDLPPGGAIPPSMPFGEPIDRTQETYRPSPYPSQKILPHGRVSPDGRRVWPEPSLSARVLVWGGAAVAAAALTAGSVLAVRAIADMITGDDEIGREADRAAEKARERVWRTARGERHPDEEPPRSRLRPHEKPAERSRPLRTAEPLGPRPSRPSRPQADFLGDVEQTTRRVSRSIEGITGALAGAMAGFRSVAGQAEAVVREFTATADQIRCLLGSDAPAHKPGRDFRRPRKPGMVDLRDDAQPAADTAPLDDARIHRL